MSCVPPSFDALFLELNNAQENARRDAASLKIAKKEEQDLQLHLSNLRNFFEHELTAKQLVQARDKFLQSKILLFDLTQEVDAFETYRNQLILNVETKMKNRISEITNDDKNFKKKNANNSNSNNNNCLCSQHKDFLTPSSFSSSSNSYFSLMMNEDHLKKVFDELLLSFNSSSSSAAISISKDDDADASINNNNNNRISSIPSTPTFDVDEAIAQEEKYLQNENGQNKKKRTQKNMPNKRNKKNDSSKAEKNNNDNSNNNNNLDDDDDDDDGFDLVKFYSGNNNNNNNLNNSLNVALTIVPPLRQIGEGNRNNNDHAQTNIIMRSVNQNNKRNNNINNPSQFHVVAPPPRATKWIPPNKNKNEEHVHNQEVKNHSNQACVPVGASTSCANVTFSTSTKSSIANNTVSSKPATASAKQQQNCRFFNHQDDDFGNSWV